MVTETVIQTETEVDLDFPTLWGVKFLNDDFTPQDFVVMVLLSQFSLSDKEAIDVMLKIHNEGAAVVGAYPKDIAFTKSATVEYNAHNYGHPLRCSPVSV